MNTYTTYGHINGTAIQQYQKFVMTYAVYTKVTREFVVNNLSARNMMNIIMTAFPELKITDFYDIAGNDDYGMLVLMTLEILNS